MDKAQGPVWIAAWGCTHTLARAIDEVQATRTTAQLNAFVSKIRFLDSYGQGGGEKLAYDFPNMFYLRDFSNFAVTTGFNTYGEDEYDWQYVDDGWFIDNIEGKGPLGKVFIKRRSGHLTDHLAPLYLLSGRYGLSDPMQPTWGGWGGRFNSRKTKNPANLGNQGYHQDYYIYTKAHDTYAGYNNKYITTARWRQAVQNDFLARLNWSVTSTYDEANHPPVAKVDGSLRRTVTSGAVVNLSAAGSTDPDGDPLMYRWWHYSEPSTYKKTLAISNAGSRDPSFVAPNVAVTQTIHIILEVTDTGTPPLTRYQRVIVTVNPGPNPPASNPDPVIYDAPWAWYWHPQPTGSTLKVMSLNVVAGYEDRPANPGEFTYTWEQVSGPSTVTFCNRNGTSNGDIVVADPGPPYDIDGKYTFSVTISDGTRSVSAPLTWVPWSSSGKPRIRHGGLSLNATAASSSQINLAWAYEKETDHVGFRITRRIGPVGEWTLVATVGKNVTSYADNGLSAGTTYYYRVQAIGPRHPSHPSNSVSATTQGTAVAVYAPSNLSASASGSSQINLSWRDNSDNESGFRIERRTGTSGTWGQIATVGANVTGYADTGLSAGTTYDYRVRAYNSGANSAYSNEANNTTQGARHPKPTSRD